MDAYLSSGSLCDVDEGLMAQDQLKDRGSLLILVTEVSQLAEVLFKGKYPRLLTKYGDGSVLIFFRHRKRANPLPHINSDVDRVENHTIAKKH